MIKNYKKLGKYKFIKAIQWTGLIKDQAQLLQFVQIPYTIIFGRYKADTDYAFLVCPGVSVKTIAAGDYVIKHRPGQYTVCKQNKFKGYRQIANEQV